MLHACTRVTGGDPVGEPASAVLAVAGPVRHRLDGREPFRACALRALRRRPACSGHRVLDSSADDHCCAGPGVATQGGGRRRLEGEALACPVLVAIVSTFWLWVAQALYVVAAILWLVPDRRIEKSLHGDRA